jgi:hypothetical protein
MVICGGPRRPSQRQQVKIAASTIHQFGVIVLFVQIGALRAENSLPDKHLRLIDPLIGAPSATH